LSPATTPSREQLDDLLSPQAKQTLAHLDFVARKTVQGLRHGAHRSKRRGVSTEFDHHKQYMAGDPIKHIDWKASARHDRYFVKRYVEDSAMTVRVILDRSGSMAQATGEGPTKYLQAARFAACICYLAIAQRDMAALAMTAADGTRWLQGGSTDAHLVRILIELASAEPVERDEVNSCIRAVADRGERRGAVVFISDLMYDPEPTQRELARISAQGHEMIVCQLKDPTEEQFPFNRWVQFGDLEDRSVKHRVDAMVLREIYLEQYQALVEGWRTWAKRHDATMLSLSTEQSMHEALSNYMAARAGTGGG